MGATARNTPEEFDPVILHTAFEKMIRDLKDKNNQVGFLFLIESTL